MNDEGAKDLVVWLKARGDRDGAMFEPINCGGRIQRDKRMSGAAIGDAITRRSEQAGIEPVKAHDLRRSHISSLLDAGLDLATVQHMAGHSSPTTTSRYDRRPLRARKAAAEKLVWPSQPRQTS